MNLKDRGITVGDLLLILIILISSTFIFIKMNKEKQTSLKLVKSEIISLKIN